MSIDVVVAEIKAGGVQGIFGLDQMDWGGQAGAFYECWKLNPCCGEPDINGAVMCCVAWSCCGPCSTCKLFANSTGEPCAIVPHCLIGWCCFPCTVCMTRYNIRKRMNIPGNLMGDCMCCLCCGPCSMCQVLRSVPTTEWNFISPLVVPELQSPNPQPFLNTTVRAETSPLTGQM